MSADEKAEQTESSSPDWAAVGVTFGGSPQRARLRLIITEVLTAFDATLSDDEYSRAAIDDPYAFFGRMRDQDPIHWNSMHELWDVTGYEDVAWVARHNEILSSNFPKYDTKNRHAPIATEDEHL